MERIARKMGLFKEHLKNLVQKQERRYFMGNCVLRCDRSYELDPFL